MSMTIYGANPKLSDEIHWFALLRLYFLITFHGCPYLKWALFLCWYFVYLPLTAEISAICQKKVSAHPLCDGGMIPCLCVNSSVDICLISAPYFPTVYMSVHLWKRGSAVLCEIVMSTWPPCPWLLLFTVMCSVSLFGTLKWKQMCGSGEESSHEHLQMVMQFMGFNFREGSFLSAKNHCFETCCI